MGKKLETLKSLFLMIFNDYFNFVTHQKKLTKIELPSRSLSLSGLALGPVSDQSPRSLKRLTGGCRN